MNWRKDPRARVLLVWCASITLPLLVAPQKQYHYLMPLYPPLAILSGWLIAEATRRDGEETAAAAAAAVTRTVRIVLIITLVAAALCACALPLVVRRFAR